jgi:hypothetical protein
MKATDESEAVGRLRNALRRNPRPPISAADALQWFSCQGIDCGYNARRQRSFLDQAQAAGLTA